MGSFERLKRAEERRSRFLDKAMRMGERKAAEGRKRKVEDGGAETGEEKKGRGGERGEGGPERGDRGDEGRMEDTGGAASSGWRARGEETERGDRGDEGRMEDTGGAAASGWRVREGETEEGRGDKRKSEATEDTRRLEAKTEKYLRRLEQRDKRRTRDDDGGDAGRTVRKARAQDGVRREDPGGVGAVAGDEGRGGVCGGDRGEDADAGDCAGSVADRDERGGVCRGGRGGDGGVGACGGDGGDRDAGRERGEGQPQQPAMQLKAQAKIQAYEALMAAFEQGTSVAPGTAATPAATAPALLSQPTPTMTFTGIPSAAEVARAKDAADLTAWAGKTLKAKGDNRAAAMEANAADEARIYEALKAAFEKGVPASPAAAPAAPHRGEWGGVRRGWGKVDWDGQRGADVGARRDVDAVGEVNEEEDEMAKFGDCVDGGGDVEDGKTLDPEMVKSGREEEVRYMVDKLGMFEFGTWDEAVGRSGGKVPTSTRWVDGWKTDDGGNRFVRSRLVGRDFKPRREGAREDLFAAMPPLEAKKGLFRMVAGMRGRRRRRGEEEVKLMFIDDRKAHLNARCEEEAWVELPEEFHQ